MAEAVGSVAERTSTSRQRSQRCSELSKVLHSLVMKLTGPSLTTSRSESGDSSPPRRADDDEEEDAALERVPKASRKKDRRLEEEDDAPVLFASFRGLRRKFEEGDEEDIVIDCSFAGRMFSLLFEIDVGLEGRPLKDVVCCCCCC